MFSRNKNILQLHIEIQLLIKNNQLKGLISNRKVNTRHCVSKQFEKKEFEYRLGVNN